MSLISTMNLCGGGMTVERIRMETTSGNLANSGVEATRPGERPFCQQLVQVTGGEDGPQVVNIVDNPNGLKLEYHPGHPGADANGMVWESTINPVNEMVDMMSATRAYEANVKAFNAAKSMAKSALEIGKA